MNKARKIIRKLGVFAATLTAIFALTVASPAQAILNGIPDGNRHPNAGAITLGLNRGVCSGILISPQYFATAAHRIDIINRNDPSLNDTLVTFEEKLPTGIKNFYQVTEVKLDPKWFESFENSGATSPTNDYGLAKLAKPVKGITPANLPALYASDALPRNQKIMELVGYGTNDFGNANEPILTRDRHYALLDLKTENAQSDSMLKFGDSQAAGCFGDSGGPTYRGADTSIVYGLNSFVTSKNCSSFMFASRLDIPDAHAFYRPFD
jgi:hypothetical protein